MSKNDNFQDELLSAAIVCRDGLYAWNKPASENKKTLKQSDPLLEVL